MQTLTMQGIADLAQVRRPVVSVWRSRYPATSAAPFPSPASDDALRFDAAEVAAWLATTGRGNNPDAGLESPLHSDALRRLENDLDRASALLLVHHLHAELLTGSDPASIAAHIDDAQVGAVLDAEVLRSALSDGLLRTAVDELAEAAFTGGRVLDRLVDRFTGTDGPWASEALTAPARELLGTIVAELHHADPKPFVPVGSGGLMLAGLLAEHLHEGERPTVLRRPEAPASAADLVAWRHLAAHGFPVGVLDADPGAAGDVRGRLHLLLAQSAPKHDLRVQIEQLLLELGPDDLLLVVGPAQLLTDRGGRHDRARLLAPSPGYAVPLRYVARLPGGLGRFGGRRRLALWVFGRPDSDRTVVGAHADAPLASAACSAIAADVAASIGGPADVLAHAFKASSVRSTQWLVRQEQFIVAADPQVPILPGGDRLARVWGLHDALVGTSPADDPLASVDLEAAAASPRSTVGLSEATSRLAAHDLAGARIDDDLLGAPAPGSVVVIGPDEIRDPGTIGSRGIDRIVLEREAPRARLTVPGDVVYVAVGGPAALVDDDGGHVVLTPARILRCWDGAQDVRLLPSVVAADIAAQSGTDRHTWRLRAVPVEQARGLDALTSNLADRRRRLSDELRTLDDLERELVAGVADGTLNATLPTTPTTPKTAR